MFVLCMYLIFSLLLYSPNYLLFQGQLILFCLVFMLPILFRGLVNFARLLRIAGKESNLIFS